MISDDIKHDSAAVYAFTNQLLIHISNNPGPLPIQNLWCFLLVVVVACLLSLNICSACCTYDVAALSAQTHEQQQLDVACEISHFENQILQKDFKVRGHTPSDGNCFYWAALDQLQSMSADFGAKTHIQL